jgi:hypothetical protein
MPVGMAGCFVPIQLPPVAGNTAGSGCIYAY